MKKHGAELFLAPVRFKNLNEDSSTENQDSSLEKMMILRRPGGPLDAGVLLCHQASDGSEHDPHRAASDTVPV